MAATRFWGVEVKGEESVHVDVEATSSIIHFRQATLGESKYASNDSVTLYIEVDNKKHVLGVLTRNTPQLSFDLVFPESFTISHNWKNGSAHFLGFESFLDSSYHAVTTPSPTTRADTKVQKKHKLKGIFTNNYVSSEDDVDKVSDEVSDSSDEDEDATQDDSHDPEDEIPAKVGDAVQKRPPLPPTRKARAHPKIRKRRFGTRGPRLPHQLGAHPKVADGNKGAEVGAGTREPREDEIYCVFCKETFPTDSELQDHTLYWCKGIYEYQRRTFG